METPAVVASSVTTAAVGTHPTGMHSCLQHKDKMPTSQTFFQFLTDQFEVNVELLDTSKETFPLCKVAEQNYTQSLL